MNALSIQAVLRAVEYLQYHLGKLGIIGAAIALASLVGSVLVVMPLGQALQHKSAELDWLRSQPKGKQIHPAAALDDTQQLDKFYRQFPPAQSMSGILSQIHQLAQQKGIVLSSGEYKLANDINNPRLLRYEIIFPVEAGYGKLRAFIEAASLQFPALGLSEINIKRESVDESGAQVKLHYFLLLSKS